MPRAPAAHRHRGKRPIAGAHRTNSPTRRRRLLFRPAHFPAVRSFSLRFALATAPRRRHKRRSAAASQPAPCPRRRRSCSRVVFPRPFLALRPFVLRYVLAAGASAPCRRRKASVTDMGGVVSWLKSSDAGRLRLSKTCVVRPREVGDLRANKVQANKAHAAGRGIGDARNITLEEDLYGLFTPLTNEEESQVNNVLYGSGHSKQILVRHEPSNIEITREKLGCLRPRGWLNDEVINLYLELLKERAEREPKRFLKCHFFNTFFYKKLACGKTGYDYQSVRRWTTRNKLGYGLVDCDKIFIPIHRDLHWCLAVINMKEKTYQYLDSLGGMGHDVLRILAQYIVDELEDKSCIEIDFRSWQEAPVPLPLPLQHNGWDCGIFMLKFIDFYSRGLGPSFSQEHMEYFRRRTAIEIVRKKAE